jgi:hypothetical protein
MRGLLLGLVGAVLAGSAWAAPACPLSQSVYEVRDTGFRYLGAELQRPDLVGQRFTVRRYVNRLERVFNPAQGVSRVSGYEAVELIGAGEAFTLRLDHTGGGSPPVWPQSFKGASSVEWVSAKKSGVKESREAEIYIHDGPLATLTLSVVGCHKA